MGVCPSERGHPRAETGVTLSELAMSFLPNPQPLLRGMVPSRCQASCGEGVEVLEGLGALGPSPSKSLPLPLHALSAIDQCFDAGGARGGGPNDNESSILWTQAVVAHVYSERNQRAKLAAGLSL